MSGWPAISYEQWRATCDTLHAHTQVLGKLAAKLAPPEPQLQHAALRLTARGWETLPLPAPDRSGSMVVVLDLRAHEAVEEHARYDPGQVDSYFAAATMAAQVLAAYRAPYRGRSTPVNAWWGSFDLAVSLFSGRPADPPSDDFITRNAGNAQALEIGWWPGDTRYGKAAFFAYSYPAPEGFGSQARVRGVRVGSRASRKRRLRPAACHVTLLHRPGQVAGVIERGAGSRPLGAPLCGHVPNLELASGHCR